jgi:cathepsin F
MEDEKLSFRSKFNKFLDIHGHDIINEHYDYEERFDAFARNYKYIIGIKERQQSSGDMTFQVGETRFMDMSPEEFRRVYLNLKASNIEETKRNAIGPLYMAEDMPESWDWNDQKVVTGVRDQGSCGSCWAFSSVANIESQFAIKSKHLTFFSEQQLVDCDHVDQDAGCGGGFMESAFKYLMSTNGLETENDYKYTGRDGRCVYDAKKAAVKVKGYRFASSQDEDEIAKMLVATGPLAIALDASPLQFYYGGIYKPSHSSSCSKTSLNHAVTLVGYGVEKNVKYWLVKNSWGSGWGEKGYFRILRGDGACGINTYVVSAEIDN